MRKLIAATIVLASVLASIFALVPAYTTWAETLPSDVTFGIGDRESVEAALIQEAARTREQMRSIYAPPLHWLSAGLVISSSALAWLVLRGVNRTSGDLGGRIPPNSAQQPASAPSGARG